MIGIVSVSGPLTGGLPFKAIERPTRLLSQREPSCRGLLHQRARQEAIVVLGVRTVSRWRTTWIRVTRQDAPQSLRNLLFRILQKMATSKEWHIE